MKPRLYSIGSDHCSGLSKLIEELGECSQVAGKIIGIGHMGEHWDGSNLHERMEDEMADVCAAITFFASVNRLNRARMDERFRQKLELFHKWHEEQGGAA